jgi:transposase
MIIGCDLGDRYSVLCVLDGAGSVVGRDRAPTTAQGLCEALRAYPGAQVVIEVGAHSRWVKHVLEKSGYTVIVANARKVRLIYGDTHKSDKKDAENLARLARLDPTLLHPVIHRDAARHQDLVMIRARDGLVKTRTLLISQVRGLIKSTGEQIPACSTPVFVKRVRAHAPVQTVAELEPTLLSIESVTEQIAVYDKRIVERAESDTYREETRCLRQVTGVGALTAMTFVCTLESADRFRCSRAAAAYLGLCPRQRQSGTMDTQTRISKHGDAYLRTLLVQCAHYIMGPYGPDTELRRFGTRVRGPGVDPRAKRRAVIAVARKLAVLLHALWKRKATYRPLSNTAPTETPAVGELQTAHG